MLTQTVPWKHYKNLMVYYEHCICLHLSSSTLY